MVGFAPGDDGTERVAVIDGTAEGHGVRVGDRLIVAGRLEVIDHPGHVVNGVRVPAWAELWVTGRLAE